MAFATDAVCFSLTATKVLGLNSNGSRYEFYLLFEFCDHDLAGLLSQKVDINLSVKKGIAKQLLTGIKFLHEYAIWFCVSMAVDPSARSRYSPISVIMFCTVI